MNWEAETEAIPLTFEQEEELRSLAVSRATESLDAVDAARTDEELFHALPEAAIAAYQLGNLGRAKELAEQLLAIAGVGRAKLQKYGTEVLAIIAGAGNGAAGPAQQDPNR